MLRSMRVLGIESVNGEMLYAFLMGTGWFFLLGWLLGLVIAYVKVFREETLAGPAARTPAVQTAGKTVQISSRK